jgi:hypothetical protein
VSVGLEGAACCDCWEAFETPGLVMKDGERGLSHESIEPGRRGWWGFELLISW